MDARQRKVSDIRRQIERGQYRVDERAIAEALIGRLRRRAVEAEQRVGEDAQSRCSYPDSAPVAPAKMTLGSPRATRPKPKPSSACSSRPEGIISSPEWTPCGCDGPRSEKILSAARGVSCTPAAVGSTGVYFERAPHRHAGGPFQGTSFDWLLSS